MLPAEHTHTILSDVHILMLLAEHIHYTSLSPELSLPWEKIRISVRHQEEPYSLFTKEGAPESMNRRAKKVASKGEKGGLRKGSCKQKERRDNFFFFPEESLLIKKKKKVLLEETRILKTDFGSQKNSNIDSDTHIAAHLCSYTL